MMLINCSFLRLRNSITFVMSTSLNVVNIAVLLDTSNNFWQLFSFCVTFFTNHWFCRILIVFFSSFADACCVVCVDAVACCFLSISSLRTTSFVFGLTSARFTPFSRAYRRAEGVALIRC